MKTNVQPIKQELEFGITNRDRLVLARMLDRCPLKGLAKHRLASEVFGVLTKGWDWFEVDREGLKDLEYARTIGVLHLSRENTEGFANIITEALSGGDMVCVGSVGRVLVVTLDQFNDALGVEIK